MMTKRDRVTRLAKLARARAQALIDEMGVILFNENTGPGEAGVTIGITEDGARYVVTLSAPDGAVISLALEPLTMQRLVDALSIAPGGRT